MSIVIPVFNEENYLKACLDAIAAQTVRPHEVIVVDNNSSDNSIIVAKRYPFVRVVSEHRQGQAYARNAGFNAVTGNLIGRIDADTVLPVTWVADMLAAAQQHPGAAITGAGYFYDVLGKNLFHNLHIVTYYYLNRVICGYHMLWGSNMVIPTEVWRGARKYVSVSTAIAEDMDLSVIVSNICPIILDKHIVVGVSFRSAQAGPYAVWKYLRRWPLSLRRDGRLTEAICWVIAGAVFIVSLPAVLAMPGVRRVRRILPAFASR